MTLATAPTQNAELVTDAGRLARVISDLLREPAVAVDTESNGYHRYPERVCLVQLGAPGQAYLVDALACDDMSPLGRLLASERVEKIIHSADYDLRSLDREWGFRVRNLYDTSVAAHLTGMDRLGLASVAQHFLNVSLTKTKSLQRADWSLRPLSKEALDYAAADVTHLLPLRHAVSAKLEEQGRLAWAREECARLESIRATPPEPPERACLSMKGSRALDGISLAVLAELAALREREARRRGRPPFRVLMDETLVYLATNPKADLKEAPGMGPIALERMGKLIRQAIQRGMEAPPIERPAPALPPRRPMSGPENARWDALRQWRTQQGQAFALDPALVWPMASLERLARAPDSLSEELRATEVRRWQAERFGPELGERLAALAGRQPQQAKRRSRWRRFLGRR